MALLLRHVSAGSRNGPVEWLYVTFPEKKNIRACCTFLHDDVIRWKHFPRYWPFVRGIHRSPVNSPHKGQWRGALMFSLICVWINGWVNNPKAGDFRRYRSHYDVIVMCGLLQVDLSTYLSFRVTYIIDYSHHVNLQRHWYPIKCAYSFVLWWLYITAIKQETRAYLMEYPRLLNLQF